MELKPSLVAVLGGRAEQVKLSLAVLADEPLTESQKFHLNQLEQVLCVDVDQRVEETEPA
jgi:hypothetical protein